jgi:hypothetical protein
MQGAVVVAIVWLLNFTTTCAISAYHHNSWEFEHRSWRGVPDTTVCYKICQLLATGRCTIKLETISSLIVTQCTLNFDDECYWICCDIHFQYNLLLQKLPPGKTSLINYTKLSPIQQYVIKFVSYLRQVGGFLRVIRFPPPIKLTVTI